MLTIEHTPGWSRGSDNPIQSKTGGLLPWVRILSEKTVNTSKNEALYKEDGLTSEFRFRSQQGERDHLEGMFNLDLSLERSVSPIMCMLLSLWWHEFHANIFSTLLNRLCGMWTITKYSRLSYGQPGTINRTVYRKSNTVSILLAWNFRFNRINWLQENQTHPTPNVSVATF